MTPPELSPQDEYALQREVDAALEASRTARDKREEAERAGCPECLEMHDHTDTENPL